MQAALQRWTGGQLVDLHVSDLLNEQLPSHFDYTSWYDLLVFRRLAARSAGRCDQRAAAGEQSACDLEAIDTSPVGFALFDRVLLTVHPTDCLVRDFFATPAATSRHTRRTARSGAASATGPCRPDAADGQPHGRQLPRAAPPADARAGRTAGQLLDPRSHFADWRMLLDSRNALHLLEDTCEDQRARSPNGSTPSTNGRSGTTPQQMRERELLRVRSRDVLEHVERVLAPRASTGSVGRGAVQMHFSAQSHRTNNIMRTLTVLTAIFLPLNLVTGFFGMNFDGLPLIHSRTGFWTVAALLVLIGARDEPVLLAQALSERRALSTLAGRIRVGDTEPGQDRALARLHLLGFARRPCGRSLAHAARRAPAGGHSGLPA